MRLDHMNEGTRTRLLRVATGLSQHDLAALVGVDRRRLSEHERNERALSPTDTARVREVLDRARCAAFGGNDEAA